MTTAIAVFIVINFVSSKQEFKKDLKRQKETAEKFVEEQSEQFAEIFNANNTKLTETIETQRVQLATLLEQNKAVIDDLIKKADEKVNALEIKVGEKDDKEIQVLRDQIDALKKLSTSPKINETSKVKNPIVNCSKCGIQFPVTSNIFFIKKASPEGKMTFASRYKCPNCKTVYIPRKKL